MFPTNRHSDMCMCVSTYIKYDKKCLIKYLLLRASFNITDRPKESSQANLLTKYKITCLIIICWC